jgi:hypothetical protein
MKHLVEDALVYPGAGLDGSPVRQCNGVVHSFIFLDYGTAKADVLAELTRQRKTGTGFAYHRLVEMVEFDPKPLLARASSEFVDRGNHLHQTEPSFGVWAVFESTTLGSTERFSFLFLSNEAIQGLATLFPVRPPRVLVVQEHGFGGNCFRSFSEEILKLAGRWNGTPEILILGPNHRMQEWHPLAESLGYDVAMESMHKNNREILQLSRTRFELMTAR